MLCEGEFDQVKNQWTSYEWLESSSSSTAALAITVNKLRENSKWDLTIFIFFSQAFNA
jgi:hypothetical protein